MGMYQKLKDAKCISSFMEFKTETEKQISKLGKKKPSDFCKQCVNIKETIIKKDREFKGCLTDISKQLKLIDVNGEIKDFTDECISVYSQCVQKRLSRDRKLVESKRISEKSCDTNGSCKQKISTVPQKNKSSPRLAPEPRSTGSSQRQISQNPRGELENAEQSRQQAVIREDQKDVKGAAITIEAKGEASESVATHHSGTPVPVVTSMQHSSLASSEAQVLDMHKGADPQHNRSTQHSHSDNTGQTSDSRGKFPQLKLSGNQDSDGKTQIGNIPDKDIPGSQVHSEQALAMKTAEGSPTAQNDLISKERGDQNPISSSTVIANTEILTPDHVDSFRAGISDSSSDHLTTSYMSSAVRSTDEKNFRPKGSDNASTDSEVSVGVENNHAAIRSEDNHNKSDDAQHVDQVTHCIKNADGALVDSGTTCTEKHDNVLFNGNGNILDTLKKFFDSIPNKNHIMQASAPMGIVLLLGLLFKYTPLWRVLTKKNMKKGAVINEELNSVLQEPSIMDDERSIPFSYGAFEYSSFDQNVY
ncbi:PIR protein [Plasmodium vivax]|uniref:VIR protein n=1 Tax=Plasmodium vivax TaxID=5855 RepID=A0A565A3Z3_PLAVI|nr:PIR protein [Plasmodium vivax]